MDRNEHTDEEDMKTLSNLVIKNASVLEAPITGGQHRAESGNISILVAGRKNFSKSISSFKLCWSPNLHCGKIGNASTLKW